MGILLSEHELYKLHNKSKWDEEKGEWNVPHFTFNAKAGDIAFPSINAKARNEQQKQDREIAIQENNNTEMKNKKKKNGQMRKKQGQSEHRPAHGG